MFDKNIDLTVGANCVFADGVGKHILVIDYLKDDLNINVFKCGQQFYNDVPKSVVDIIQKPFTTFGKITFWNYILGIHPNAAHTHKSITSPIKIAYTMFESDRIPNLWVDILNQYYDMAVVPDPYLVSVYKSCGVKIPIFVIPLGILVEKLLAKPLKTKVNNPFTFGMSAGFFGRKQHIQILEAFGNQFGNDPKFKLRLHGRSGPIKSQVEKAVKDANFSNVELITTPLSPNDYDEFMDSLDVYVFVSQGEGYSITPREILALGKPCILSNNTCHKTICNSGFVIPIAADQKVPAIYEVFNNQIIGNYYKCDTDELSKLMKNVVDNYDTYLTKAAGGRDWVKQSLWPSLKPTYLNLFRPKSIELGKDNYIDTTTFRTSNKRLFNLYKSQFKL